MARFDGIVNLEASGEVVPVKSLRVNEFYGPVFQGEGPDTGAPYWLLRLAGCNLDCSWCDTPYSWDWDNHDPGVEVHAQPWQLWRDEVREAMEASQLHRLLVTGGEPLLQQKALTLLAGDLPWYTFVAVETNGTYTLTDELAHYVDLAVVSPKLGNSGIAPERRWRHDRLAWWGAACRGEAGDVEAYVKAVVADKAELTEVQYLVNDLMGGVPADRVWIMPEGEQAGILLRRARELAPLVAAMGWRLSLRTQALMYGAKRGV